MFGKASNTNKQGNIGIADAVAHYTGLGQTVLLPLTDSQKYDIVVDTDVGFDRVQVKTVSQVNKSGNYVIDLRTTQRGYHDDFNHKSCEILYVLDEGGGRWIIPTTAFDAKTKLTLNHNYKRYKDN